MPEETVAAQAVDLAQSLVVLGAAGVLALFLHVILFRTLFRLGWRDRFAEEVTSRGRWPSRVTVAILAVLAALPLTTLGEPLTDGLQHGLTIAAIVTATWWAVRILVAVEVALLANLVEDEADAMTRRRRQTQVILLRRVFAAVIVVLAIGAVLLTFDEARSLGTSLLASAGILSLVAGIAAQATLGNLIAGIQIAVAEPVKLGDLVEVEGEWGWVEEISLTYVVVQVWDQRRVILPTSYFVNTPFRNWTRDTEGVWGTVYWYLDHRADVDAIREEFLRQLHDHPLWTGDWGTLLVVDTTERCITVRGGVSGPDGLRLWDLRCDIREGVLAWIREHQPEALPATRLLPAPDGAPSHRDHGRVHASARRGNGWTGTGRDQRSP